MNKQPSNRSMQILTAIAADRGIDPFMEHLCALGPPTFDERGASIKLQLQPCHMNGVYSAHGGLMMTLLDVVMACSASDAERTCVTVEMKSNFIRPGGQAGQYLKAQGFIRARGNSLAFCDGEIRNQDGELLATASGTFKYIKAKIYHNQQQLGA